MTPHKHSLSEYDLGKQAGEDFAKQRIKDKISIRIAWTLTVGLLFAPFNENLAGMILFLTIGLVWTLMIINKIK